MIFTRLRHQLRSPWLWGGVVLACVIFAPNVIWQARHDFTSLDFLRSIHARDVAIGRTQAYLVEQRGVGSNPLTVPLWVAGLYYYFRKAPDPRYPALGWMYVIPFGLLLRWPDPGFRRDDFLRLGLVLLGEKPQEVRLLGLGGRFWALTGDLAQGCLNANSTLRPSRR